MSVPKAEKRKMKGRIRISVVGEKVVLCSHVTPGALRSDSSSGRASLCPLPSVPQGVHRFPEHAAGPNDLAQGGTSRPAVMPPRFKESWRVSPWIYPVWDSLCFQDLINYFLSHIREIFNYNLFKHFLSPFLFLFFFWDPYN